MAVSATFALKAGVWFRRGRLLIVSPDSLGTACPLSGRNSTYRPVQISGASSNREPNIKHKPAFPQLGAPGEDGARHLGDVAFDDVPNRRKEARPQHRRSADADAVL